MPVPVSFLLRHRAMIMNLNLFPTLSLASASAVTEQSKRTWWRRIEQGEIFRASSKTMRSTRISLLDVTPHVQVLLTPQDLEFILRADAGDADAQNDVGQLFLNAGKPKSAVYWLEQSARQGHADSMQCLGRCYAAGQGVPQDSNLSLMWTAKAAALGHLIARSQLEGLMSPVGHPWRESAKKVVRHTQSATHSADEKVKTFVVSS